MAEVNATAEDVFDWLLDVGLASEVGLIVEVDGGWMVIDEEVVEVLVAEGGSGVLMAVSWRIGGSRGVSSVPWLKRWALWCRCSHHY